MAIHEQCCKCGRDLSSCPFYDQETVNPCENYLYPINNQGFFSHFFSYKGRIGRLQYLVTALIAYALFLFPLMMVGEKAAESNGSFIVYICFIPCSVLHFLAMIKRLHDKSKEWWWAFASFVPYIGVIVGLYVLFMPGDEGLNDYGTEPLKPYKPQVEWEIEEE